MISKVSSGAVFGLNGYIITVESDMFTGLPGMDIVGLPDTAVKESKERVKSALKNVWLLIWLLPIPRKTEHILICP